MGPCVGAPGPGVRGSPAHTAAFPRREQEAVAAIAAPRSHRGLRAPRALHEPPRARSAPGGFAGPLQSPEPRQGGSGPSRGTAVGTAAGESRGCLCRRKGEAVRGPSQRPREQTALTAAASPLSSAARSAPAAGGEPGAVRAESAPGTRHRDASSPQGKSLSAQAPSHSSGVVTHLPQGLVRKRLVLTPKVPVLGLVWCSLPPARASVQNTGWGGSAHTRVCSAGSEEEMRSGFNPQVSSWWALGQCWAPFGCCFWLLHHS